MRNPNKKYLRTKTERHKIKRVSLKSLRQKAWKLQSEYIRQVEKGICYTCGSHNNWKNTHCGHYIHKDCLDFTPMNLHCQCIHCNKWLHGNSGVYAERLIADFGEEAVANLRTLSYREHKFNIFELEDYINKYTVRLKELSR